MTEPLDDTPPPEEIEMAAEELLGRPLSRPADERLQAITQRIDYLKREKARCLEIMEENPATAETLLSQVNRDLAEAEKQLTEWRLQHGSRN